MGRKVIAQATATRTSVAGQRDTGSRSGTELGGGSRRALAGYALGSYGAAATLGTAVDEFA